MNNIMRHQYKELTEDDKTNMQMVKDTGLTFWETLDDLGSSRELALAKTKIEEAVMWATKHVTG